MLKMWLKITVLCTCLLIADADVKIINPSISPFMARENFPMNFTCSADLTMEYSLFWYRNGSKIESDPTARIIITQSVLNNNSSITVSTLYISNMNESGEYRCTEENSLGEKKRDSSVTIKFFTVYVKHSNVSEGADVSIDCRPEILYKQVTVTWSRAGKDIHNHMDRYVLQNNNRTLIVRASTPQDAGEFMCSITFVAGMNLTQSFQQSVSLSGKPYFTEQKSNEIRVNLMDTLDLACPVSGYQLPKVYWLRKCDSPVVGSDREVLDSYGGVSEARLRIANVTNLDLGQYTCAAENANGRIVKEFWVKLVGSAVSENTRGVVSLVLSLFLTLWVMETP